MNQIAMIENVGFCIGRLTMISVPNNNSAINRYGTLGFMDEYYLAKISFYCLSFSKKAASGAGMAVVLCWLSASSR